MRTFDTLIADRLGRLRTHRNDRAALEDLERAAVERPVELIASIARTVPEATAAVDYAPAVVSVSGVAPAYDARQSWSNYTAKAIANPFRVYHPQSLDDVQSIVHAAAAQRLRVRAVGSSHSWSDVAACPDVIVETHELNRVLSPENDVLLPSAGASTLFRTECGITIHDLNLALERANLALSNMGGYDGQTIVGATATATHGSGIAFGPLSSFIVSMDVVLASGALCRFEPASGITDAAVFRARHPGVTLVQSDDHFNTLTVALGSCGIVYSVYLRVEPKFWLVERRDVTTWQDVKQRFRAQLGRYRHYELSINPHARGGRNTCVETMRNPAPAPSVPLRLRPHRTYLSEHAGNIPGATEVFRYLFKHFPGMSPALIEGALRLLKDDGYVDLSFIVLPIGAQNNISAYSSEIAVPLSHAEAAIDTVLDLAARSAQENIYHSAPVAIRFVKRTPSFLAMQYGGPADEDICMVEFPTVDGTVGGIETIERAERALYRFGGRPHWGQINFVSGSRLLLERLYPRYATWRGIVRTLDPDGMFTNAFTDRMGISSRDGG